MGELSPASGEGVFPGLGAEGLTTGTAGEGSGVVEGDGGDEPSHPQATPKVVDVP